MNVSRCLYDRSNSLSMLLGFGGVYVLISSFHDDDDGDDGEKYILNLQHTNSVR